MCTPCVCAHYQLYHVFPIGKQYSILDRIKHVAGYVSW